MNLSPNDLERFLQKPSVEFRKDDLVRFIEHHSIEMINFRYVAEDGKLKSLNFIIQSRSHLDHILTFGERVDGSSLFSFIDAGSSDLYVIPRYRTAFVNPFSEIPSLEILCSFFNSEGKPLENAPEYILKKARELFTRKTGMNFKVLGELEYYVNSHREGHFEVPAQKGYHSSAPHSKWEHLRKEAIRLIARAGGRVKYGHNEVGGFSSESELFEQHEIEFLPSDPDEAADQLVIAKWILRMLAHRHGVEISFAPKISEGQAGSGLHIHMLVEKDGKNVMAGAGGLSDTARRVIAGVLDLSAALTAFGNTIPTSYLRLVPEQEAPTRICWGDRNRSVLLRVPLGWVNTTRMIADANPLEDQVSDADANRQTVELRSPDGSADIHSLIGGIVMAALHGIQMENALEVAGELYADSDIHRDAEKYRHLRMLPGSCFSSAEALAEKRAFFEEEDVFPAGMIDSVIRRLKSYGDENLSERIAGNQEEIRKLVLEYIHVQ